MIEYPKIEGPFRRGDNGKIVHGEWRTAEFEYLQDAEWHFTEKVDGTNIRIGWDGENVEIGGRTANAQLHADLVKMLRATFADRPEVMKEAFGTTPVTLFGEGYGAGIQKGGFYRPDKSFILFDVLIGDYWLKYADIAGIADKLDIDVVPLRGVFSLNAAIEMLSNGPVASLVAQQAADAEGLVGVPTVPLFDRRGNRIIIKLKTKDLWNEA